MMRYYVRVAFEDPATSDDPASAPAALVAVGIAATFLALAFSVRIPPDVPAPRPVPPDAELTVAPVKREAFPPLSPEVMEPIANQLDALALGSRGLVDSIGKHARAKHLLAGSGQQTRLAVEMELTDHGVTTALARTRRLAPGIVQMPWSDRPSRQNAVSGLLRFTVLDRLLEVLGLTCKSGARELLDPQDFRIRKLDALPDEGREISFVLPQPVLLQTGIDTFGQDSPPPKPGPSQSEVRGSVDISDPSTFRRAELAIRLAAFSRESLLEFSFRWKDDSLTIPFWSDGAEGNRKTWLVQSFDPSLLRPGRFPVRLRCQLLPGSRKPSDVRVEQVVLRLLR
ncbi:MAG: hypothetical protein HY303_03690 [Candidatus Wallbacteria bacterium]|nr:hypothetical protein [Candidatus Wallbacteria bacterium]